MKRKNIKNCIETALGRKKADLLIKNCMALNVFTGEFEKSDILITDEYIADFHAPDNAEAEIVSDAGGKYAVPGFIDGHIHLESTFISPAEFSKIAAMHGTSAVITDPHELANVAGTDGIDYMLAATENLSIDVFFMIPSCVPASYVDETGATLAHTAIKKYMKNERVLGLAEMMNYPGVLSADKEVLAKLSAAAKFDKEIDGHAPGLTGSQLSAYCAAGINSDHECTTAEEAIEKLRLGQWIMIREGTACKNLEALIPVLDKYPGRCVFSCDDKHPSDIIEEGHIDHIVRRAINLGIKPETAYTVASFGAAQRFRLKDAGAIAPGYKADIVLISDLEKVKIEKVFKGGKSITPESINELKPPVIDSSLSGRITNTVNPAPLSKESFALKRTPEYVIQLTPWQIITKNGGKAAGVDLDRDIIKLSVVERFKSTGHIGTALLSGYGLKRGAVATTVAHDSHNIIVAGVSDSDMTAAVNRLKELRGGMVVIDNGKIISELALPIGGLMTFLSAYETADRINKLRDAAHSLGVSDNIDPFMTLSFVSLPVIPSLRLTTLGVFDVKQFKII